MFGWLLSVSGLVLCVVCVNAAFNSNWLINDSSGLKDKEGRASWVQDDWVTEQLFPPSLGSTKPRRRRETGGESPGKSQEVNLQQGKFGNLEKLESSFYDASTEQGRKLQGSTTVEAQNENIRSNSNLIDKILARSPREAVDTKNESQEQFEGSLDFQDGDISTSGLDDSNSLSPPDIVTTSTRRTTTQKSNVQTYPIVPWSEKTLLHSSKSWEILGSSVFNSPKVKVHFSVDFPKELCCPGLVLGTTAMIAKTEENTCFTMSERYHSIFQEISTIIFQLEPNKTDTYCTIDENFYHCHGTMYGHGAYSDTWEVAAFNRCDQTSFSGLQLWHNITFEQGEEPECQFLDNLSNDCHRYYEHGRIPNIFGAKDQSDARDMANLVRTVLTSGCHQHVTEFGCRSIFAECSTETLEAIFPCRSMCEEVMDSCRSTWKDIPMPDCTFYPEERVNTEKCFKKEVRCPAPDSTPHGQVRYEGDQTVGDKAVYTCDLFFQLDPTDSGIRTCTARGIWGSDAESTQGEDVPVCVSVFSSVTYICIVLAGLTVVALIGIVMVHRYRYELKVLLHSRLNISLQRNNEDSTEKYDAFVLYNKHDRKFVHKELIPRLEKKKFPPRILHGKAVSEPEPDDSNLKLIIHERDFELGEFISRNILMAVEKSRRAIVVMSESFIRGHWGEFEFEMVSQRELKDKNFKVIIILMQDPETIKNVPEQIRAYMRMGRCIKKGDRQFWDKLKYEMRRCRKKGCRTEGSCRGRQQREPLPEQEGSREETALFYSNESMCPSSCSCDSSSASSICDTCSSAASHRSISESDDVPDPHSPITLPTNPSIYRKLQLYFQQHFTKYQDCIQPTEDSISLIIQQDINYEK